MTEWCEAKLMTLYQIEEQQKPQLGRHISSPVRKHWV